MSCKVRNSLNKVESALSNHKLIKTRISLKSFKRDKKSGRRKLNLNSWFLKRDKELKQRDIALLSLRLIKQPRLNILRKLV